MDITIIPDIITIPPVAIKVESPYITVTETAQRQDTMLHLPQKKHCKVL